MTWAKNKLLLTAIRTIKAETTAENELAASELINEYTVSFRRNLSKKNAERDAKHYNRKLNEARLLAINLQRKYIKNLLAKGEIEPKVFDTLTRLLDYREETLDYSFPFGTMLFLKRAMRDFAHLRRNRRGDGDTGSDSMEFIRDARMQAISETIASLEEYAKTQEQPDYVYAVILEYEKRLQRLKRLGDYSSEKLEEQKEELRFKVLDAERFEIRRMYEAGEISAEQEKELRRFVNNIEGIVLYEPGE